MSNEPTINELNRRLTRLEALVPALGRLVTAVDSLAWVVGNDVPHMATFISKATDAAEDVKLLLLRNTLYE